MWIGESGRGASRSTWRGLVRRVVWLVAAVLALAAMAARTASADVTVRVSTVKDQVVQDSQCSLREALDFASSSSEPDCGSFAGGVVTIVVPAGCYRLSSGLALFLNVNSPVSQVVIAGAGAGPAGCGGGGTVIDAQHTGTVLSLSGSLASVAVSGVTLTGGLSCGGTLGCDGGGISNGASLSLNAVTITGNAAGAGADQSIPGTPGGAGHNGGGIDNLPSGRLTVTGSTISGNAAGGGGAGADGSGNSGAAGGRGGGGGGIYNVGGTVTLVSSTISDNTAGGGGTGGTGDQSNPGGNGGAGGDGGGIWSAP
ncbi:MAG TPA: hypothetical protein VMU39_14005, partial [Solirubrobacteraceae bacterium]|nr:hypothetical protein [Solirubrobacteraceae bacterium]